MEDLVKEFLSNLVMLRNPFPNLIDFKRTSPKSTTYNCIAWAFGCNEKHWWPQKGSYWPISEHKFRKDKLNCFLEFLTMDGWEESENVEYENGFVKIALYVDEDREPTHLARLLADGLWTSKLGEEIDISHSLDSLDGPAYGKILKFFKKKRD